ncbi:MAG TPA: hypothetical protein O0X97_05665 [Methanocorpusculum sp.]|nr:hypothetical protein [Methanocorpusculum sp.]
MPEETAPEAPVRELTDEEILKRADKINEAREKERQEELKRAEEVKKAEEARKAEELKRAEEIRRAEEAQKAAKIAEAERLKREEEAKKEEELRNARKLVNEDDAKKAAEAKAAAANEPKKKKHTGLKVVGIIVLLLIVFAGLCLVSCSFTSTPVSGTPSLSYTSSYTIWLPQGETTIAGQKITVVGTPNEMMITLPGMPAQKIEQGQTVKTNPATMSVYLLWGAWKVMDITYVASFTYKGTTTDGLVTFDTLIATDKQIPEFLLNIVLSMAGIKYQNA